MGGETSTIESLVGQVLGSYRLTRKLGQGGMGAVFTGLHEGLLKEFAVKVLPKKLADTDEFIQRFKREAQRAAQLEHPNIVATVDFGIQGDYYYMAMTLVDGVSLKDKLKTDGRLNVDEAVGLFRQAVSGLQYAHGRDIIHRDIKPDNLLIGTDGNLRIVDFGLARRMEEDVEITRSEQILGTPLYMPVEQWRGDQVDARADIYSLGITFYHMLTGRPPFLKGSVPEILKARLQDKFPPPRELRPEIPKPIEALIMKMIAREAKWRPQSMDEVEQILKETYLEPLELEAQKADWQARAASKGPDVSDGFHGAWTVSTDAPEFTGVKPVPLPKDSDRTRASSRREAVVDSQIQLDVDFADDDTSPSMAKPAASGVGIPSDALDDDPLPSVVGDASDIDVASDDDHDRPRVRPSEKKRRLKSHSKRSRRTPVAMDFAPTGWTFKQAAEPRKMLYRRFGVLVPLAWIAIISCLVLWWYSPPPGWELQPYLLPADQQPQPPSNRNRATANAAPTNENAPATNTPAGDQPDQPGNADGPDDNAPPSNRDANGEWIGEPALVSADFTGGELPVRPNRIPAGRFQITSEIIIPVGASLRLDANAQVAFAAGVGITVHGELTAPGPARLSAIDAETGSFSGIRAIGETASVRLTGTTIEHAAGWPRDDSDPMSDRYGGAIAASDGATVELDGCTIQRCRVGGIGGAILLRSGASGTFTGLTATGNVGELGGGVFAVLEASATIRGGSFTSNLSRASGGVIMIDRRGVVVVEDATFRANNASTGGAAMVASGSRLVAINCTFETNTADNDSGGTGGAIAVYDGTCELTGCKLIGNRASHEGGAMAMTGTCSISLTRIEAGRNQARSGGFASADAGAIRVTSSAFTANRATGLGGAFFLTGGELAIGEPGDTTVFESNEADEGGAIRLLHAKVTADTTMFRANNARDAGGGAISAANRSSQLLLTNCRFIENVTATSGGAISIEDGTLSAVGKNTLFANNVALSDGGAIRMKSSAAPNTINGATFRENVAHPHGRDWDYPVDRDPPPGSDLANSFGGAAALEGSRLDVIDCRFESNQSIRGGALHVSQLSGDRCETKLVTSTFTGNRALLGGGALHASGTCRVTLTQCELTRNKSARDGGALVVDGAECLAKRTEVSGNVARRYGGAIRVLPGGELRLAEECNLHGNEAIRGGAIEFDRASPDCSVQGSAFRSNRVRTHGGAISVLACLIHITANKFAGNGCGDGCFGSAIFMQPTSVEAMSTVPSPGPILRYNEFSGGQPEGAPPVFAGVPR